MKNTKRNKINIIFSSFLVIGYIVCTYFFSTLASQVSGTLGSLIRILMLVVFGLLLFYATRVGEGKQVRRFSLAVLLLIDLPSLYIIIASLVPGFPFHDAINPPSLLGTGDALPTLILMMACVALGYGIPYTFFSGYEIREEGDLDEAVKEIEDGLVEGGLAEELAEVEAEQAIEEAEEAKESVGELSEEAEQTAEEAAEEINEKEEKEEE